MKQQTKRLMLPRLFSSLSRLGFLLGLVVALMNAGCGGGNKSNPSTDSAATSAVNKPDANKEVKTNSEMADEYVKRGLEKYRQGDTTGAISDYDKAIELDPTFVKAYGNRGHARGMLNDFEGALSDFDKVLELEPMSIKAYNGRGLVKSNQGDYIDAIAEFDKALEIDSVSETTVFIYSNRGLAKFSQGDFFGAIDDHNKAIELSPSFAVLYNNRGLTRQYMGDIDAALEDYNKAIELDDDCSVAYVNRGNILGDRGDFESAIADYKKAIELKPDYSETYLCWGLTLLDKNDSAGAIEIFSKAIEATFASARIYNSRGREKEKQGDMLGAIADYDKAIEMDPLSAKAYNNRGLAKREIGNISDAIRDFTKAIELASNDKVLTANRIKTLMISDEYRYEAKSYIKSDDPIPTVYAAYLNRCITYARIGDFDSALSDCTKVIDSLPAYDESYALRGAIKSELRDDAGAIEDFNRAIKLNPKQEKAYYQRASVRIRKVNLDKAMDDINRALEINPRFLEAWEIKAKIHGIMDQTTEYNQTITEIKKIHPDPDVIEYLIQQEIKTQMIIIVGSSLEGQELTATQDYMFRAAYRTDMKRFDGAIEDYENAIKSTTDTVILIQCLQFIARIHDAQRQYASFLDTLRRMTEIAPENIEALYSYAEMLLTCKDETLRDAKKALLVVEKATELSSKAQLAVNHRISILILLAQAYFENAMPEKAAATQQTAIDLFPVSTSDTIRKSHMEILDKYKKAADASRDR